MELITASARHMITSFVLFNPIFTLRTSLRTNWDSPLLELVAVLLHCILRLLRNLLWQSHLGLVLLTSETSMERYLASEAEWVAAFGAVMPPQLLVFCASKEIVTICGWAVKIISRIASLPDHSPLKLMHSVNFLLGQKLWYVFWILEWHLAAWIWTIDMELALFNLRTCILNQTLFVIYIVTALNAV